MKRIASLLLLAALLLAPAGSAHAQGVNLSWDACGSEGADSKGFACDTNTGESFTLWCSVVPPEGTTAVTGVEVIVDVIRCYLLPPDWWQFKNAGACRQTALSATANLVWMNSNVCTDYWAGQAQGGLASYTSSLMHNAYGRGRIYMIAAIPTALATPLDPSLEYAMMMLTITRAKTTGTGACGGCNIPVGIYLTEIKLTQPVGVGDYRMSYPAGHASVGWQMAVEGTYFQCGDPVRNSTWGAIKAQYR